MKRFLIKLTLAALALLFLGSSYLGAATPRNGGPSGVMVLDEHPWDFLKHAVRIQVLLITDEIVILLVWFDLNEPPIIVQMSRSDYDGGISARQKPLLRSKRPSVSRE